MTIAMLSISLVDGLAKYLSASHSPLYISWARYAVASMIVLPLSIGIFGFRCMPTENLPSHAVRTFLLVAAMTLYFVAISRIPMASAITAFFIGPIVATIIAVSFLKEHLTIRKLCALLLGFCGVIIIVRPTGRFELGIILALASGFLFGLYMVVTRLASKSSHPVKTLTFQCLFGMALLFPLAIFNWSVPSVSEIGILAGLGILSAISHFLSIYAFKFAETATLAPLVYLELLGSVVVGYTFFGEIPDATIWIGAFVIAMSGILLIQKAHS